MLVSLDARRAVREAGLRYSTDARPGIRRRRAGRGFAYVRADGTAVRDRDERSRIERLAVPPAWTQVWICPTANGHLQATGRDARGRKQYRYHARWTRARDETKYDRLVEFAGSLPKLRRRVRRDLARARLPREKVLATAVRLLESTLIRVGNEEYARENHSFGLTTMRDRHVAVRGATMRFRFAGKSGVRHEVSVEDARLARIIRRLRELPGQELFQYVDGDGEVRTIDSGDVNEYLREATGRDFTAKDFRTWAGTVLAARALRELGGVVGEVATKKNIVRAVEAVARRLGNTRAVCRKCYVHPAVLDAYVDGTLLDVAVERAGRELERDLSAEELLVLAVLRRRLRAERALRRAG